jgi:HEAT repeat protein
MPDRAAVALAHALGDPEPFVRWQAGQSLIALSSQEAMNALGEALRDPSSLRRAAAAEALGQPDWVEVVPFLADMLADKDAGVRAVAALALGQIGHAEGVPHLAARLEREPSPGVRWAIIRALGVIGVVAGAESLSRCLARPEEPAPVRRNAVWALGRLGWDATVVESLLAALNDPDPPVRWEACLGLGSVAQAAMRAGPVDRGLLQRVRDALADRREDGAAAGAGLVSEAASQALAQIDAGLWARRTQRRR